MRLIEGLKELKLIEKKISKNVELIGRHCALMEDDTPTYKNQHQQVTSWLQSIKDLSHDYEELLDRVHRTNNSVQVTIELHDGAKTKTINQWLAFRQVTSTWLQSGVGTLTDRGLSQKTAKDSDGNLVVVNVVRFFNPEQRDRAILGLTEDRSRVDAQLEIVNATTDLVE